MKKFRVVKEGNVELILNSKYKTINFYNRLFRIGDKKDDLSIITEKNLHFVFEFLMSSCRFMCCKIVCRKKVKIKLRFVYL